MEWFRAWENESHRLHASTLSNVGMNEYNMSSSSLGTGTAPGCAA